MAAIAAEKDVISILSPTKTRVLIRSEYKMFITLCVVWD
jgi:hypothetical protein